MGVLLTVCGGGWRGCHLVQVVVLMGVLLPVCGGGWRGCHLVQVVVLMGVLLPVLSSSQLVPGWRCTARNTFPRRRAG